MAKIISYPIEVPDGYTFDESYKQYTDLVNDNTGLIILKIIKEPIKDWDYYVSHYFNQDIRFNFSTPNGYCRDLIFKNDYDNVPFEIKIGILKYIVNNMKIGILTAIDLMLSSEHQILPSNKITDICPKEFLLSIKKELQ